MHATHPFTATQRWMLLFMLAAFVGLGHFNRVSISVAGTNVFIQPEKQTPDAPLTVPQSPDHELPLSQTPAQQATGQQTAGQQAALPQPMKHVFSETKMSFIYTGFLIIYALAMIPCGWLIDRIGAAKSLLLLSLSMGTFVALTGVLGWVMTNAQYFWWSLLFIRGLAGFCSAPLHPGAARVVHDVTTPGNRSVGNGLITAGAMLGISLSFPLFGTLMDAAGWPTAFVICGLVLAAYGLVWYAVSQRQLSSIPSHVIHVGQQTDGHAGAQPSQLLAANRAVDAPAASAALNPWMILTNRTLILVTLSYAAYSYFQYLFFYWQQNYFEHELHVPTGQARTISMCISLTQGFGMVAGGAISDAVCRGIGNTWGRRLVALFGMGGCALLAAVALQLTDTMHVAVCIAAAVGCQGMCEGVFWTAATEIGGKNRGLAGAFMNAGGNAGGLISPTLSPLLAGYLGWPGAIGIACGCSAIGGLLWLAIKAKAPEVGPSANGPAAPSFH